MAERYHRIELGNSTLGLEPPFSPSRLPPGLETVVVPLPDDLPFAEFQKHGKKGHHLPPRPEWIQSVRPKFRPTQLPALPGRGQLSLALSYTSGGTSPFCRVPAPSRAAARFRFFPRGVCRFGNSSKTTSGARNSLSAAPVAPLSRACRYLRAIPRFPTGSSIFASTNSGSPPPA